MTPAGYLYKKVATRPDWLTTESIKDIYSLSSCISEDFADYINFWKHNGYWLFDSPVIMDEIATEENIDLSLMTIFYYEVYEYEFDNDSRTWTSFLPEPAFTTHVQIPAHRHLEGFDVVTFSVGSSPECSPLSCNSLATTIQVNQHCLFSTFQEAKESIEAGQFEKAEPGPHRIFAVYTLKKPS